MITLTDIGALAGVRPDRGNWQAQAFIHRFGVPNTGRCRVLTGRAEGLPRKV